MDKDSFEEAPHLLSDALDPGEQLLWWDRPPEGLLLRPIDAVLIPVSLVWAVPVLFIALLFDFAFPFFSSFLTAPFVLIAIYILIGRFIHDAGRRKRTVYGLTSERALIAMPGETKTVDLAFLGEIHLKEAPDGTGTIIFGQETSRFLQHDFGLWIGRQAVPTFEKVKNAKHVFATIREVQREARKRG